VRRETFPVAGPIRLELGVPAGNVVVEAGDVSETVVELEPIGGEESRAAVEETRIDLRDGVLVVDVPEPHGIRFFSRSPEVHLAVRCPHDCDLEVRASSADVRASGRFASADVEAASGDVELSEVAGDARVKTASGDVELGAVDGTLRAEAASGDVDVERVAADARIRAASGDVTVGRADASLTIQTASGDQRVGSVSTGEVTLRSAAGDIWVGIGKGSGVWLDVSSMSGDTTSELDVAGGPPADPEEGPRVELRAQSMSGDIHVARADAPPALDR
jgi:DUF4097 and DUF4098 domain-containing protein YvlB